MKIAFTSTGKNWDSQLDSVFGRAAGYILIDDKTNELKWYSNLKNRNAGHGAGVQAGQNVAAMEAEVIITGGDIGPKAFEVLKKADIEMYADVKGKTVKEAFEAYKNGELTKFYIKQIT